MTKFVAMDKPLISQVVEWENLLSAYSKAAKGKRGKESTAAFEFRLGDELTALSDQLSTGQWMPGGYRHFYIHEPKRRLISAAPFGDRVVHHALCNVIEPYFEKTFIKTSFANRRGLGVHAALDCFQKYASQFRYVLRADVQQHFASIDHRVLVSILRRHLTDNSLDSVIDRILESGKEAHAKEYHMHWFPGDDLLAICRDRGLPIGNLTSQFWSNCYLNPFDHFVKRELRCKAYLRYVDDFALFSDSKAELGCWLSAITERLQRFRLCIHENSAQACPTRDGVPWLGMVIYPDYRHLKARKVRNATRHLTTQYRRWQQGAISFAELDACVKGWVNHASHADSWRLRSTVLARMKS